MRRIIIAISFVLLTLYSTPVVAQSPFWRPVGQPEGGLVISIVADYDDRLFAVAGGRVHRSIDSGESWTVSPWDAAIIDPTALTPGRGALFALVGTNLYRSTDAGDRWSQLSSLPGFAGAERFVLIAYDSSRSELFASTGAGVLRSTDNGDSWMWLGGTQLSGRIYAAAGEVVLISGITMYRFDADDDYSRVTVQPPVPTQYAHDFAIDQRGYFYIRQQDNRYYRSTDRGGTWKYVTSSIQLESSCYASVGRQGDIFLVGPGIWRSTDNGGSWKMFGYRPAYSSSTAFASTSNSSLYIGSNEGVHCSIDSGWTWTVQQRGISAQFAGSFVQSHDGRIIVRSEAHFYQSSDDGHSWDSLSTPLDGSAGITVGGDESWYLYGATRAQQKLTWLRSTDHGGSWTDLTAKLPLRVNNQIVPGERDEIYIPHDNGTISLSSDGGYSWSNIKTGTTLNIRRLAVDSTDRIFGFTLSEMIRSTDRGENWERRPFPAGTFWGTIDRGGQLYASGYGILMLSTDAGDSWKQIADSADLPGGAFMFTFGRHGEIYALTADAVIRTSDGGESWQRLDEGLYQRRPTGLIITRSGYPLLGTEYGGMYIGGEPSSSPRMPICRDAKPAFAVLPNPIASQAMIRLDLPMQAQIRVRVVDILGREIGVMIDERLDAGSHRLALDVSSIAQGAYLLCVSIDGEVSTQSFVRE